MTADLDLSPEAVERLLSLPRLYLDHEGDLCCERAGDNLVACPAVGAYLTGGLLNPDMWEAIPQFQALARALSAELAAAREALAEAAGVLRMMTDQDAIKSSTAANAYACCVSAEAKARKVLGDQNPIKKSPSLDALLSVATDDEADAIRACAERLADTEGGA